MRPVSQPFDQRVQMRRPDLLKDADGIDTRSDLLQDIVNKIRQGLAFRIKPDGVQQARATQSVVIR